MSELRTNSITNADGTGAPDFPFGLNFTGTPTAPTAAVGTNTTQIATTAFVNAEIANDITGKADLASPAFTGVPTAPTATVGTNTTQLATTAFVNAEIANDAPTKTGTGASGTWGISISGTSANTTSISSAVGGTYTWTGSQYFQSNANTGSSFGVPLQAYSSSGGAIMAFHRAGVYAVNMGLDSDNVFRIGGWSAGANRLQLDMSGNLTLSGALNANYTSSEVVLARDYSATFAHGLGARPSQVLVRLRCVSAQLGYAVDDVVYLSGGAYDVNSGQGINLASDATNIYFGTYWVYVRNRTGGSGQFVEITYGSWRASVVAWR